jgi:hypothetical protein
MGHDPNLMSIRTLLLRTAGYVVDEAYDRVAALSRAQCDTVDALLICHTVSESERRWLAINVRRDRALMPILCLTLGIHELVGDGCIAVPNEPEELISALTQALKFLKTIVRQQPGERVA